MVQTSIGLFCDIMTVFIPSEAVNVPEADASCVAVASGMSSETVLSPVTDADACDGTDGVDES